MTLPDEPRTFPKRTAICGVIRTFQLKGHDPDFGQTLGDPITLIGLIALSVETRINRSVRFPLVIWPGLMLQSCFSLGWLALHHGDVFVRGGMENNPGFVLGEDSPHGGFVQDIGDDGRMVPPWPSSASSLSRWNRLPSTWSIGWRVQGCALRFARPVRADGAPRDQDDFAWIISRIFAESRSTGSCPTSPPFPFGSVCPDAA